MGLRIILGAESCLGLGDRPEAPSLSVLPRAGQHIECHCRHPVTTGDSRGGCAGAILLLQDVLEHQSTTPLLAILEDLQDPGNAGTILRTADAAGANGIICTEKTVDFYNAKVVRASMGSVFHLPFHVAENLSETLIWLRNQGIQILAAHLDGGRSIFSTGFDGTLRYFDRK
ncbi:MAG: TrmH family RNA methyltransferase [Clostridia bacterium]